MPQVNHAGAEVYFETSGDGPPLLLLAGLASDMASWGPLPPLLGARQLIRIDNRGSGRTRSTGPITLEMMTDDVAAVCDALGLGAVDIVGHSMGGMIGLTLAATQPERVRKLVTMTSGAIAPSKLMLLHDLAHLYETARPADFFRMLYQWLFSEPFFADARNVTAAVLASTTYPYRQSPADMARQVAAFDARIDWQADKVRCPVLALSAQNDILAPVAAVQRLHEGIADCRHEIVPGAGHSLHWEQPAAVAGLITAFLS